MNARLPPANWLRTFELVARNMSFTEAAEQLSISTSAVSQQIKRLEDYFGCKLFRRVGNRMCLTDAAEACIPSMRHAFAQLEQAIEQINGSVEDKEISVSIAPSFASKWLVGRLHRFFDTYPRINLNILSTVNLTSFDQNDIDIAIRYGSGIYPGLEVHKLMPERIVAVASPDLICSVSGLDKPEDLAKAPLLHDCSAEVDRSCPDWQSIAKTYKIDDLDWENGPKFNQSALVVESAVEGCGVGLVKYALARRDIERNNLICLFDWSFDVCNSYYLLHVSDARIVNKINVFRSWMLREVEMDFGTRNHSD